MTNGRPRDDRNALPNQHFEDKYWIDFVRGLGPADYVVEMQQHLDNGCEICYEQWGIWRTLFNMARDERLYEPPQDVVQKVKGFLTKRQAVTLWWLGQLRSLRVLHACAALSNRPRSA